VFVLVRVRILQFSKFPVVHLRITALPKCALLHLHGFWAIVPCCSLLLHQFLFFGERLNRLHSYIIKKVRYKKHLAVGWARLIFDRLDALDHSSALPAHRNAARRVLGAAEY
jgi:hypothetical protein